MSDKQTVLVVDDDPAMLKATCMVLKAAGIHVMQAETGREALSMVRQHIPDLVLLDVNLPDMSGFDVCRAIKADERTAHLLVMHLSASSTSSESQTLGLDSGADGYIVQPVDNRELVARVRAMLRLKHSEDLRRALEGEVAQARSIQFTWRIIQGLAHEIRNPLFALDTNAAALRIRFQEISEAVPFLDNIHAQVKRLDSLMRYLMELGQARGGHSREVMSVRDLISLAIAQIKDHGITPVTKVTWLTSPESLMVRCDGAQLAAALMHLIQNAWESNVAQDAVEIQVERDGNMAAIRVVDHGTGIPTVVAETLFEPFVTSKVGMSGLGLALVKEYVEGCGGTVAGGNNQPGPGATFVIRLPLDGGQ